MRNGFFEKAILAAAVAVWVGGFAAARSRAADAEAPADLVVLDANVLTIVDASPQAEAFAVRDGRFVAVGKSSEMERYIGPKTQVLHLKGKTVTPGFNDAHLHPSAAYAEDDPRYVVPLGPEHVKTMDDLVAALKRRPTKRPRARPSAERPTTTPSSAGIPTATTWIAPARIIRSSSIKSAAAT